MDIPYVLECLILQSYFKAVSILRAAVQMNDSQFCCLKWRAILPQFLGCPSIIYQEVQLIFIV